MDSDNRGRIIRAFGPEKSREDSLDVEYSTPTRDDPVEIADLLRAIWRRKWTVVAATFGTAALFLFLTASRPHLFSTSATLMLDARQQQIVASREEVVSDLQLNDSILESELAVLQSASLLREVIESIGIERFASIDPALAEPGALSLLRYRIQEMLAGPEEDTSDEPMLITPEQRRMSGVVAALQSSMYIGRVGSSYVMRVSVTLPDPELAALVANRTASLYIERQLGDRRRVAENATAWLTAQVQARGREVAEAEAEVERYRQEQLESAGASEEVIDQQLAELNQQLAITRSEKASEQARLEQLLSMVESQGAMAAAETQTSDYMASLRTAREELLREDARLAATFGPSHPDRRRLASDLARVEETIAREIGNLAQGYRNGIEVLDRSEASLQRDVETLEQRLVTMAASSLELRQLEREADGKRETFQELLGRLGETRAQAEIQRAEAKLVNEAQIPTGPSAPRPTLMTAFGATLGLTVSLIAVLLMELLSGGFRSAPDLKRATRLPVLATLPKARLRRPLAALKLFESAPNRILAERFRQLRTFLTAAPMPEGEGRSLLVTSSVPNEGKTTSAIALAETCARAGLSTILLDLDTRQGSLSQELRVDGGTLSEHLSGEAALEEVIARPPSLRFHIASLEKSDPGAGEISEQQIASLLAQLKGMYQMVIIDGPPILSDADSLSAALSADQIIYLVRWQTTKRSSVTHGLGMLKSFGVEPDGLILTMADTAQIGESRK